ncbi:rCG36183, isoform CRA_b [Rattus norvegicus]|uniref:RCG36183, isoform CRA_b n=1 Tax=Rattus norvegicus TaxID=10116 RepID=A6IK87_RAT|nr:rCG36183, isoform CRA_b [Rattus norvegicus]
MGRAQASHFHSVRLLCWAWSKWREGLALRMEEQQKLKRAALHSQRTLLHRALQKWLVGASSFFWVSSVRGRGGFWTHFHSFPE